MKKRSFALRRHFLLLLLSCFLPTAKASIDTLRLYYPIDQSDAIINASRLDSLLLKSDSSLRVRITAYTDFLGGDGYNFVLSNKRARSVRDYLVGKGLKPGQVLSFSGKGKINGGAGSAGNPANRRVDILIIRVEIKKETERKKEPSKEKKEPKRKEKERLVEDEKLKVGETFVLKGLLFKPGQHFLAAGSEPVLEELLELMKEHPAMKIEIQGHVCCLNKSSEDGYDFDEHTWQLSFYRAMFVYTYLVDHGIDPARMNYRGFGGAFPKVFPESTEEDRGKNRRVEIKIMEK